MNKTSAELERKVIELYESGLNCKKISLQIPVNSVTAFNILKRNNIKLRTKGGIDLLPIENIIQEYQSGISTTFLAEKYNVESHTICNYLEKAGIKRENIYHNIDMKRNYFHTIDSYDKAYFLGFLLTDGNVSKDTNNISLSISTKDEKILEVFKDKIKCENQICRTTRNRVGRKSIEYSSTLSFKSQEMKNDLATYNVIPNKTYVTTFPKIDTSLMSHLFRGMIDGDGWISNKSHQIGFCGNEQCVTKFRDYMVENLSIYKVKILHTEEHLWQVTWGSTKDIEIIGNFIYKDKRDCYLERKYNNFLSILA